MFPQRHRTIGREPDEQVEDTGWRLFIHTLEEVNTIQYYFDDPELMLQGIIRTPKFNLQNEIMLRKHVHAIVISELLNGH